MTHRHVRWALVASLLAAVAGTARAQLLLTARGGTGRPEGPHGPHVLAPRQHDGWVYGVALTNTTSKVCPSAGWWYVPARRSVEAS